MGNHLNFYLILPTIVAYHVSIFFRFISGFCWFTMNLLEAFEKYAEKVTRERETFLQRIDDLNDQQSNLEDNPIVATGNR